MGQHEIDQTAAHAGDSQPTAAMMQVIIDTHGKPGEKSGQTGTMASTNIEQRGTDELTINQFENGVKYGVGPGTTKIEAPLGGRVVDLGGTDFGSSVGMVGGGSPDRQRTVVYDSHNKVVAELDKDKVMHVHTKNGEYTETQDGKVTFQPAGTADLRHLHHTGPISQSHMENYGLSSNGDVTRFPNGVERNAKTGNITIPSEYPNFHEDKRYDDKMNLISQTGTDGDGKVLYKIDDKGFHVPTADGTISQNRSGAVRFDAPAPGVKLPNITITDGGKKPEEDCFKSSDPLCGLDLGKF